MRITYLNAHRQNGAILVVSLLLLLVMTVLALTASQSTRMQERMAGNARDVDLAFQAGEASLRAAETRLSKEVAPRGRGLNLCDDDLDACDAGDSQTTNFDYGSERAAWLAWWKTKSRKYDVALKEVSAPPQHVTELWTDVTDTITEGGSQPKSGTLYFVNTSRAQGATDTASVIIETTYASRY